MFIMPKVTESVSSTEVRHKKQEAEICTGVRFTVNMGEGNLLVKDGTGGLEINNLLGNQHSGV